MENYSFYLFMQLRMTIAPSTTEYDVQFDSDFKMYQDYLVSGYNDSSKSEYECMENYLKSIYK